ncbi:MAG: mobile mystery protein A [Pseudomonadaceae bacterium]|nr:mobile mystery protein A [Pseudomonadaceae bacterium]
MSEHMRSQERAMARKNLDKRLNSIRDSNQFARPPKGWVKAIREALGMTAEQLAARMGVTKPRIYTLEKAEIDGALTLESLQRAANALDCELVYALVPRHPLETVIQQRAIHEAKKRMRSTAHTMSLEDQSVDEADQRKQIEALAKELEHSGSALWSDE